MASRSRSAQMSVRISVEELGRVRRAADSLGKTAARFVREAISDRCSAVEQQRSEAGDVPSSAADDRLARVERLVLAAVAAHAGLGSVAAVSRAAGVSWSAARRALDALVERGAIRQRAWTQSWCHGTRDRRAWEPDVSCPGFRRLWAQVERVSLPTTPPPRVYEGPLPAQFWALFWNHPDPASLALPTDADYIANRLLNGPSAHAALWASVHLAPEALRSCLKLRSTQPRTRSLVENALAHRSTVPA